MGQLVSLERYSLRFFAVVRIVARQYQHRHQCRLEHQGIEALFGRIASLQREHPAPSIFQHKKVCDRALETSEALIEGLAAYHLDFWQHGLRQERDPLAD
jgi:hypothetical protein